jgi:hypothetical protein
LYTKGLWLLPIGPDKKPYFNLLPRVEGKAAWKPLQTHRVDANTVCRWFQEAPDCNVGIICGNGLLVVDVDGDKGRTTQSALPQLPRTVTAITGRDEGGMHFYFRLKPGRWERNAAGTELHNSGGIDLQCDGNYVVAPPSLHPEGRRYRWADGLSPDEIEIADAPEWLYDFLEEAQTSQNQQPCGTTEWGTQERLENTGALRTPIDLYKSIGTHSTLVVSALDVDPWSLARDYQVMQKMARACGLEKEVWEKAGACE